MSRDTRQCILDAMMELVQSQSVKGVTTRAIAQQAGVSEVTLFRHFKSKDDLLRAVIAQYSPATFVVPEFLKQKTGDLEADLRRFCRLLQEQFHRNREVVMLSLREAGNYPELDLLLGEVPLRLKKLLLELFEDLVKAGKLPPADYEALVVGLLALNFGAFMASARYSSAVTTLSAQEIVEKQLDVLVAGLRPSAACIPTEKVEKVEKAVSDVPTEH